MAIKTKTFGNVFFRFFRTWSSRGCIRQVGFTNRPRLSANQKALSQEYKTNRTLRHRSPFYMEDEMQISMTSQANSFLL